MRRGVIGLFPPNVQVKLYFDGQERQPFWVSRGGEVQVKGADMHRQLHWFEAGLLVMPAFVLVR